MKHVRFSALYLQLNMWANALNLSYMILDDNLELKFEKNKFAPKFSLCCLSLTEGIILISFPFKNV